MIAIANIANGSACLPFTLHLLAYFLWKVQAGGKNASCKSRLSILNVQPDTGTKIYQLVPQMMLQWSQCFSTNMFQELSSCAPPLKPSVDNHIVSSTRQMSM